MIEGNRYRLNERIKDLEYKLKISETGNKQLCEEIKRLVKEKAKLIDSLIYLKRQYETDFTSKELEELEPRDECIYSTIAEILKEIDVEE